MLDSTTKKSIDDCRDVLVGKVPDPKSQIEQITLALIYKFMDDMDRESVEKFKGKAKFFAPPKKTGDTKADKKLIDYSKYSWRKLFNPALSGAEMLALYSEALEKLNTNPNIPELFRNIFKNAYLPYRDPSTLKLFLKYINEFEYSHSEKLGDAFEYLLSVMGSQGDAGQFRTPRHIIDFVTACVNPQKNETVLDPACGTAGFLLSAYKHILNANPDKKTGRPGGSLTPEDKKKLVSNFTGYDISPDMVRLSLANMYLHNFPTPKIVEYDSLTSEDRWSETYDVILANPPFMTPKGGIRPHKKFGVQANKAEVLFTDYIAEHLTKNGRAGIVVPNGIVATSQAAYAQLRKHLVEDSLIAVISLPSGVFQPYSGVKTSVLILDKKLAKKSEQVLFFKVENDGFDLGAQRREHDKNDLPLALQTLETFKETLINNKTFNNIPSSATLVEKKTILENRDVILNVERYFEEKIIVSEFTKVRLGDITEVITKGTTPTSVGYNFQEDGINFIKIESIGRDGTIMPEKFAYISEECHLSLKRSSLKTNDILFSIAGALGRIAVVNKHILPANTNQALSIIRLKEGNNPFYIANILKSYIVMDKIENLKTGVAQYNLSLEQVKDFEIPLPPIEIQQQIVNEIEAYQKIIDGAKQIVRNYKPMISINSNWKIESLSILCEHITKGTTPTSVGFKFETSGINFIKIQNLNEYGDIDLTGIDYITDKCNESLKRSSLKSNDILFSIAGTKMGITGYVKKEHLPANTNQALAIIRVKETKVILHQYLFHYLRCSIIQNEIEKLKTGVAQSNLSLQQVGELKIHIPSLEEQKEIVIAIEEEMQLVENNKKLIQLFEAKIKNKIAEVWGVKKDAIESEEELMVAAEPEVGYKKKGKVSI